MRTQGGRYQIRLTGRYQIRLTGRYQIRLTGRYQICLTGRYQIRLTDAKGPDYSRESFMIGNTRAVLTVNGILTLNSTLT